MTICRQNGAWILSAYRLGERKVHFCRNSPSFPSTPSNPGNIFLGTVYRSPSLCDAQPVCQTPALRRRFIFGHRLVLQRDSPKEKISGYGITDSVGRHAPSTRKPSGPAGPEGFLVEGACRPTLSVMPYPEIFSFGESLCKTSLCPKIKRLRKAGV